MSTNLETTGRRTTRFACCMAAITVLCLAGAAVPAAADTAYLEIEAAGLEDLGPNWTYEGWAIVAGEAVSTGTFTVTSDGSLSRSAFAFSVDDRSAVTTFVLTIEPVPDMDPGPSHVHLLGGDFAGGEATATVGHPAALGDDFTAADGPYILNAPSAGGAAGYAAGIWWLDPATGPGPTLMLPTLPDGWQYEGWVAGPEGALSTGRFTDPAAVDSDGPGATAGPYAAPPLPGQDFVNPPLDLGMGYAAVISVEPQPDNSPAPFTLKPLIDMNIDDVGAGVLQDMSNQAATSFPSLRATLLAAEPQHEIAQLMLDIPGLDDLGSDWVYEGWLIVNGTPVSTGTFTVSGGTQSQKYFATPVSSLAAVGAFVLTIEPAVDQDPAPSAVHVLAGDFSSRRARLSAGHPAALGDDFTAAAGTYILNTPSGDGAAPYTNGIWWLDPAAGPGPVLDLPMLPEGWVYEGWVVGSDGPVSTGRFTSASGADSDGAGASGGSAAFPPFPGQDFVDPARDLTMAHAAVISIEPEPDTSAAPFTFKPLVDVVIDDVGAGVLQPMANQAAAFPTGSAVLLEASTIAAGAHADGVNGTAWFTDLVLANRSMESASVLIELLEAGTGNPQPSQAMVMLPAMASMRYQDAFSSLFDFEGNGALRVHGEPGVLDVTSRTYTASGAGSYGQAIPAYSEADTVGYGDTARLVQLAYSTNTGTGFRSNLGFVNAGTAELMVHAALFSGDGSWVGTISRTLAAGEPMQLTNVFDGLSSSDVDAGYAELWTDTPGGRFFAYASVVDNMTGDASYVMAR